MRKLCANESGFLSLLGLLLAIAIICFVGYKAYGTYLSKPKVDSKTRQALSESGIDVSNDISTFQSMKERIKSVNQSAADQYKQIEQMQ